MDCSLPFFRMIFPLMVMIARNRGHKSKQPGAKFFTCLLPEKGLLGAKTALPGRRQACLAVGQAARYYREGKKENQMIVATSESSQRINKNRSLFSFLRSDSLSPL